MPRLLRHAGIYAVITGDIVNSTRMTVVDLARLSSVLEELAADFARRHPQAMVGRPAVFRGDAWQILLAEPEQALRLAALVTARLHAALDVRVRMSIGIGRINRIHRENITLSTGEAFTLSGQALDAMPRQRRLTGALPARAGILAGWFSIILQLCGGVLEAWTRHQADLVAYALLLEKPTGEAVRAVTGADVSVQAIRASLLGAEWRLIHTVLKQFQATDWAGLCAGPQAKET